MAQFFLILQDGHLDQICEARGLCAARLDAAARKVRIGRNLVLFEIELRVERAATPFGIAARDTNEWFALQSL
jgi:hypothetical protein